MVCVCVCVCACVCVCVYPIKGECQIKEENLHGSMGRLQKEGGARIWTCVPDGGWKEGSSPRTRPSPRPEPLWKVCLCHFRAHGAVPFRWAHQALLLAGSFASSPSPRCRGPRAGWACCVHAGPPRGGGGSPISRFGAGGPPAPRVHWLASRAHICVCRGVHGTHTPFGWPR